MNSLIILKYTNCVKGKKYRLSMAAIGAPVRWPGTAISSNSDGTLTVVHEGAGDVYRVIRTIPTFFGGRNMAIEPHAGTLFIAHGNMKMVSTLADLWALRFGWDGLDVARFEVAP